MFKKKSLITLVSLLAILCVTVGGTLAFLIDTDGPVENIFTPSKVTTEVKEDLDGNFKKNVQIKNTGDTEAYIRAAVVITWQDAQGNVYGQKPDAGTDYSISFNTGNQTNPDGKWTKCTDDFYYWSAPVAPDKTTGVLITSCSPVAGRAPDGYSLTVEIIGSGIQSKGKASNGETPVYQAWGVTVNNDGTLNVT